MEARVARLETGLSDIRATLVRFEAVVGEMSKDLAGIRSDVTGLRSDLETPHAGIWQG